jgi:hypothetical protein
MSIDKAKAKLRRNALVRALPKLSEILRASLITRYTSCGKPGCKCMRGQKHGPSYTLSVTLAPGKTKQLYVRQQDVGRVRRQVENYEKLWRAVVEISNINFELLRAESKALPGQPTRSRSR